jgi:2-(1,2-epoxy-1,2-dihydrophenyl)acetyl-CoA isomerase
VAVGGGANLALSGDFVLASDSAKFCQVFIKMNIIPDGGGTYFLPRLVGLVKARELAFLGDMVDGKTAHSMGLIYKSVPDDKLDQEVDSLAKNLSERSLTALSLTKASLERSLERSLDTCLEWEAAYQCVCSETEEHKEAVRRVWEPRGKNR